MLTGCGHSEPANTVQNNAKAGDLGPPIGDVRTKIFQGRADLSGWDGAVKK